MPRRQPAMMSTLYGGRVAKGATMTSTERKKRFESRVLKEGGFRPADIKDYLNYGRYYRRKA